MINISIKNLFTTIVIYISLFFLFYLEPLYLAGIKIAILWKLPLVAFLTFYLYLKVLKYKTVETFVLLGILISFKMFISISALDNIMSTFSEFTKLFIFFLLFVYIKDKFSYNQLETAGKYLSIFVILSFIPFMLGLLKPLGRTIEMSTFGDFDASSLIGIFQNPHSAGLTLSITIIIIFYYLLRSKKTSEKIFLFLLVILGITELFLTFVRTPIVMLVIGLFIITVKYFKLKHYLYLFITILISFTYISQDYGTNPLYKSIEMRFKGENKFGNTGGIGSGRSIFWEQAIINWQSEGLTSTTIGLGIELAKDKMKEATGLRVFAHNGYLQQLQAEGIIGFILLIMMFYYIYRYMRLYKNNEYYLLMLSIFIMHLISFLFQGGNYFLIYLIFSIYLSLLSKTRKDTI